MTPPILGNALRDGYLPAADLLRRLPAGYAQFFGYASTGIGLIREVGLLIVGGGCTSVDVGIFNAVNSGGNEVPHELLALGSLPGPGEENVPPGFVASTEGTEVLPVGGVWQFAILRGPEGTVESEEWPPGSEPYTSALTGEPKHPGDVLTDTWKYICRDAEGNVLLEGFYKIKVKRLTRPNDDVGNVWVPISDTAVPFANGEYATVANNIGGEEEGGVSHFAVTISELAEEPIPAGTETIDVEIQGGRTPWFSEENLGARPSRASAITRYVTTPVLPHEGRHARVPTGAAHEYFIGIRPVGGDLVIPFTKAGGAADRHKEETPLADNPAVAIGGAGAEGEEAPVAFAAKRVEVNSLV